MTATKFGSIHEINQFGKVFIKFNIPVGVPTNYIMEEQEQRQLRSLQSESEEAGSKWIIGRRNSYRNSTDSLWINNSILNIRGKSYPVVEVSLQHFGDMADLLDFQWECTHLTGDTMSLELVFDNPTYVSYGHEPDILTIIFYDNSFFLG